MYCYTPLTCVLFYFVCYWCYPLEFAKFQGGRCFELWLFLSRYICVRWFAIDFCFHCATHLCFLCILFLFYYVYLLCLPVMHSYFT